VKASGEGMMRQRDSYDRSDLDFRTRHSVLPRMADQVHVHLLHRPDLVLMHLNVFIKLQHYCGSEHEDETQ
jgi:hypothetical protein